MRSRSTLRGTRIVSGTEDISFLQIPSGMITHTTGIMTTIPMDNPHQSVEKLPVTGQIDDPTLKALRIS